MLCTPIPIVGKSPIPLDSSESTPPPHSSAVSPPALPSSSSAANRGSFAAAADGGVAGGSNDVFYNLRVVVHSRSYIKQEVSEGTCDERETMQ